MFYIGLALSRCTVTSGDQSTRFQTLCLQNSSRSIGLVITEFDTWINGEVRNFYDIEKHEGKYSSTFIKAQGQSKAKHTVVGLVDAMEELGMDATARFEAGNVGDLKKFESSEQFMHHLQELTQNKQIIMEVRKELLDEQLAEAYRAWGSW